MKRDLPAAQTGSEVSSGPSSQSSEWRAEGRTDAVTGEWEGGGDGASSTVQSVDMRLSHSITRWDWEGLIYLAFSEKLANLHSLSARDFEVLIAFAS